MKKSHMIELFGYNNWANKKLLNVVGDIENEEFIRDLSSSFKSIRDTMVHILGVEELWLSRWKGEQDRTLLTPVDFPTYTSLASRWDRFSNQINSFMLSLKEEDLTQEITIKPLN